VLRIFRNSLKAARAISFIESGSFLKRDLKRAVRKFLIVDTPHFRNAAFFERVECFVLQLNQRVAAKELLVGVSIPRILWTQSENSSDCAIS